jgi:hypothetical protein
VKVFAEGGYSYVPGGFQYSAAVKALAGCHLTRARLTRPLPLSAGFARVARHLHDVGRPLTALAACELRSPRVLSEAEFVAFNRRYVGVLEEWGLYRDGDNPVARCNLVLNARPPAEPVLFAFTYCVPGEPAGPGDFLTSGAADAPDVPHFAEHIVRRGETSLDALREKLAFACGEVRDRLTKLGTSWGNVTMLNVYSRHDLFPLLADLIDDFDPVASGYTAFCVQPPVTGLELEIDARRISSEVLLSV